MWANCGFVWLEGKLRRHRIPLVLETFGHIAGLPLLPDELRQLGYDVSEIGEASASWPHAIEQELTLTSCGDFEALTEGSKPLVEIRTRAGIVRVQRFGFSLP